MATINAPLIDGSTWQVHGQIYSAQIGRSVHKVFIQDLQDEKILLHHASGRVIGDLTAYRQKHKLDLPDYKVAQRMIDGLIDKYGGIYLERKLNSQPAIN